MLDQSLIKSNFIGKDGFIWWIGQIPPEENHHGQINGAGWGNRYKVRILGYDSPNLSELSDDELRWAQVMLPTTAGSGAANQASSVSISPGDTVFGFFLDGAPDYNVPVILGVFGRTSFVPSNEYTGPFQPYTGYTSKVDNDGANLVNNESNENNANSQKSPRNVSPKQAKKLGPDERSYYGGIGDTIKAATGAGYSVLDKISVEIDNFVNRIQTISDNVSGAVGKTKELITSEIGKISAKIQKISSGLINNVVNNLYTSLKPILNAGLKLLYDTVYALVFAATGSDIIAHKAGVAAQNAMILPTKLVEEALPCIANSIISSIGNVIRGLVEAVANNVENFVTCVSDQFIGGLVNHIIGGIDSIITPALNGVEKILMGFDLISFLRSTAEGLISGKFKLSCNQIEPDYNSPTNQWVIGKGAKEEPGIPLSNILDSANLASSIAESFIDAGEAVDDFVKDVGSLDFFGTGFSNPGFKGLVSDCYGGPPLNCGGAKVKIFGGGGSGATAKAILGSLVNDGPLITGSIIGFDITDGGSNYDFPPFVEIIDECNQGYGAIGRAIIDYNEGSPTYGQVTSIYVVSEGENYPVTDRVDETSPEPPYVIDDIVIIEPGTGYTPDDIVINISVTDPVDITGTTPETIPVDTTITTPDGTTPDGTTPGTTPVDIQYAVNVGDNGEIVSVSPINSQLNNVVEIKELPVFKIISKTGYGAKLKAKLKPRQEYQGSIKEQIDCITN